ncbi:Hypothetical predicted protein [Mytilus galloprovincialis]|uniref:LRRNT domain-containing protein n=1 Tax=Mytilus galloprovincialis TaxID=29158 RepID=A0A8B6GSD2_MYTGA|nr:Hypothetical predicted protein [Mytilus galloprovincialis]
MLIFSLQAIHLTQGQGCPNMCTCLETSVDCSFEGFTQIPNNIPSTTTRLDLSENSITSIDHLALAGLTSLLALDIKSNPLVCCSMVEFVDWVNGRSWDYLDEFCIDHNKTTDITMFNTSDCIMPEPCSIKGKESDNKSGKGSDNKSGKWLNNKSGIT